MDRVMSGASNNPRSGDPIEVARVALFLASDDAGFVNGEVIKTDAGWMAYSIKNTVKVIRLTLTGFIIQLSLYYLNQINVVCHHLITYYYIPLLLSYLLVHL